MPTPPSHQTGRIDALMEQASAALVKRHYFECEQLAAGALRKAHALQDYDRMARILMPLQESRRMKRDMAFDAHKAFMVTDEIPTGKRLVAGCYLVAPPRVGVDGRALREHADQNEVPVIVLVREPTTRDGLWPIVSVGPVTVRTKVMPAPPAKSSKAPTKKKVTKKAGESDDKGEPPTGGVLPPAVEWFMETCEALGDAAISSVPDSLPAANRVDMLFERLEALPDHEKLHQRLADACRDALREPARKRKPVPDGMFDDEEDGFDDE